MRIAQIAPLHEAVPPKYEGDTERAISYLTDALVALGHDVTLFASGDSRTSAHLEAMRPCALGRDPAVRDKMAPHMLLLEHVYRLADEFDVLHFHLDYLPFSLFSRADTPFLTTLHGRLDPPELRPVFNAFSQVPVVSISARQRMPLRHAHWLDTVPYGLPADLLQPRPAACPAYLALLGRICPEKQVDAAIRIAARSGLPLKIATRIEAADQDYFRAEIEPLLAQAHVEFIGNLDDTDHARKSIFLSNAKAVLMLDERPGPGGLDMIEAMACGTPVIAFADAAAEIVDCGTMGFVVGDVDEAVDVIRRIDELSRAEIRAQFERRFTAVRMAQRYADLYELLQTKKRPPLRCVAAG